MAALFLPMESAELFVSEYLMQMLSICSCGFTVLGSPLIVQMGSATATGGGKAAIAIALCSFGIFTTGKPALVTSHHLQNCMM